MNNKRKPTFFTSDLHFGHQNVIDFSKRPFRDVDHQTSVLISKYNSVVPENGVCFLGGDIGFCGSGDLREIIDQLNGTKILIIGNHDKRYNSMYNAGFDAVMHMARFQIAGQTVTMSHCPLLGLPRENTEGMKNHDGTEDWHGSTNPKRRPYTCEDKGQFHLHGHIHSPNSGKSKKISNRQYDIGVDANNYMPVSIGQIESWITKTLRDEKRGLK